MLLFTEQIIINTIGRATGVWLNIQNTLAELAPNVPDDGTVGFIAYNVPGKPRMKMKTGKFLGKKLGLVDVFSEKVLCRLTEKINFELFGSDSNIRLDTGDAIRDNYDNSVGGISCMTGNRDYVGLYAVNPKRFAQLVMILGSNSARAIVHTLDNGDLYMDRVYSDSEELKERMIDYARSKKWAYYLNGCAFMDGIPYNTSNLVVSGLDYDENEIPYMDTMTNGVIRNGKLCIAATGRCEYELLSQDGMLESGYTCENCGDHLREDDVMERHGYVYCEYCFNELFTYCESCEDHVHRDDTRYIESEDVTVCDDCVDRYYFCCEDCGEYCHNNSECIADGKTICESCLEDYICCDDCGDCFKDCTETEDDTVVCNTCASNYNECIDCGVLCNDEKCNTCGTAKNDETLLSTSE